MHWSLKTLEICLEQFTCGRLNYVGEIMTKNNKYLIYYYICYFSIEKTVGFKELIAYKYASHIFSHTISWFVVQKADNILIKLVKHHIL